MKRVGIRELRQNASALLRLVERGATIQITDRGRPVAVLAPVASGGPLERLREAGLTVPARRRLEDLTIPAETRTGISPSDLLRAQREERLTPAAADER